ncbi:hypothetical protein QDX21_07130 [Auritidibacter ignavus]|uniref:Uncharacterized protein n=1 Tax=Auritidibacter ignavus TaxID=678932 RepID=A0AAJ6AJM8_9MICC|nr:hypothetical protein [Auritidibacter ignavus]WGH92108.1 hypothetical protein QDX21_07130 [Auritidibacter ignavus]
MSYKENIHQLANHHVVKTPLGYGQQHPLLDQLEASITPGNIGSNLGTKNTGPGSIINHTAVALWQHITNTIDTTAKNYGATTYHDRKKTLKQLAKLPGEDQLLDDITGNMVDQITNHLDPLKPWHPQGTCPNCGNKYAHDSDGIRKPVFSVHYLDWSGKVRKPSEWVVECGYCDSTWEGEQDIRYLTYRFAHGI